MVIISTFAACLDTIRMAFSPGLRVAKKVRFRVRLWCCTRATCTSRVVPSLSASQISYFKFRGALLNHSHYTTTRATTTRYNVEISEENLYQLILHNFTILYIIRWPTILLGVLQLRKCLCKYDSASSIKFYLRFQTWKS